MPSIGVLGEESRTAQVFLEHHGGFLYINLKPSKSKAIYWNPAVHIAKESLHMHTNKNLCEDILGFLTGRRKKREGGGKQVVIHSWLVLTALTIVPSAMYNVQAQPQPVRREKEAFTLSITISQHLAPVKDSTIIS